MKTTLTSVIKNKIVCVVFLISIFFLAGSTAHGQCTFYQDLDADGFGNPDESIILPCGSLPFGYVTNNSDCDDEWELYADNDGDGFGSGPIVACGVRNNFDCDDALQTFRDNDHDGFGSTTFTACGGTGTATNNLDCNDFQLQFADLDGDGFGYGYYVACNGVTDNSDCDDSRVYYQDLDGDGFGWLNVKVPCGGITDFSDCNDASVNYTDNDNDGYGTSVKVPCGGAPNSNDCNDALVLYNDFDDDGFGYQTKVPCGGVANNLDCDDDEILFEDKDGDLWGSNLMVPCIGSSRSGDCDDNVRSYEDNDGDGYGYPNGPMPCGGVSNAFDCDDFQRMYEDYDHDGYGSQIPVACYGATNDDDCDDYNASVHPNATELLCDGIDNDCDKVVDAGAPALTIDAGPNKIVYRGYADSSCTRLQSSGAGGGVAPLALTWSNGSHATFINACPTSSTVYYLTISDANGCSKRDSVKVCVVDVRCGSGNKKVLLCHGTGSVTNPFTSICIEKADAKWHLLNHRGEQLGSCGTTKSCDWDSKALRLGDPDMEIIPEGAEYLTSFPNPFENSTTVRFMLPENDVVTLNVFDTEGRKVATLFYESAVAGTVYETTFSGEQLSHGIYFLQMISQGGVRQVRKLVLNK